MMKTLQFMRRQMVSAPMGEPEDEARSDLVAGVLHRFLAELISVDEMWAGLLKQPDAEPHGTALALVKQLCAALPEMKGGGSTDRALSALRSLPRLACHPRHGCSGQRHRQ